MNLSIAIVGFPNVGKSTLFNALLKRQVALAANYPFATIEPNVGLVEVPDKRLPKLAEIVNTSVIKPAVVEFVDVAGLVRGASKGEGLGNQFLAHIRETSAICHVLREFKDEQVLREGAINPVEDVDAIRTELQLADLATLEKQTPPKGSVDAKEKKRWAIVESLREAVENGQNAQSVIDSEDAVIVAKELNLLTSKPETFVLNVGEEDLSNKEKLSAEFAKELQVKPTQVVVISAKIESELSSLATADQQAYLQELGLEKSGLERLAATAYDTLKLQSFLTAGEKEVRAWTIEQGTTAQKAAGVIHTDFAKKFIKAQVISYDEFVKVGGWKAARDSGKVRQEGADYVMQEGDVVEFMIGR